MKHKAEGFDARGRSPKVMTPRQASIAPRRRVNMALVGYARVSSVGQSLGAVLSGNRNLPRPTFQTQARKALRCNARNRTAHCDKIFMEKKSGAKGKRPRLTDCMEYVREGDTLLVTRLDRLARSTLHLCQIADELQHKQVNLEVIDQNIDTSNATGRLLFNMLSTIAQFETEIRAERQMEGIIKAKERGVRFGWRSKIVDVQYSSTSWANLM